VACYAFGGAHGIACGLWRMPCARNLARSRGNIRGSAKRGVDFHGMGECSQCLPAVAGADKVFSGRLQGLGAE
jgi:hypothetical protein